MLLIFGYGTYRLFINDTDRESDPDWFSIRGVTDLEIRRLETVTILQAVLFLEAALDVGPRVRRVVVARGADLGRHLRGIDLAHSPRPLTRRPAR